MNGENLISELLHLDSVAAQRALLTSRAGELSRSLFEAFKARADGLALQEPQQALEIAEVALLAASFANMPLAKALARWARGNAYLCLGDYPRAGRDYERARDLYAAAGERQAVGRLQTNLVAVHKQLGRYADALALAAEARETLAPWAVSRYTAALEMNVGSLYRLLGKYAEALAAYKRGRDIFAALGNEIQVARMDINRARALMFLDRFREAESLLENASATLTRLEQTLPATRANLNRATLLSRQGRHSAALTLYRAVRERFTQLHNATDVAVTELYMTYDYLALNLLPEALSAAEQAQESLTARDMPRYVALAQQNWATAARKQGRYTEALTALAAAREQFAARGAVVDVALLDLERAVCQQGKGAPRIAVDLARGAATVLAAQGLRLHTALAQLLLAENLLILGESDQAQLLYSRAQVALRNFPALAWQAHAGLGQVAEGQGHLREAYRHYQEAIESLETTADALGTAEFQAGFLEDKTIVYQRAVAVALQLMETEQAFYLAERAKTGVWRDFVTTTEAHLAPDAQAELTTLRQQWHWLYRQLLQPLEDNEITPAVIEPRRDPAQVQTHWRALQGVEQQLLGLRRSYPQLLQRQPLPLLHELRQRIPEHDVLLNFYCTAEAIEVFIVDQARLETLRIAELWEVTRLLHRWRFNLESMRLGALEGRPVMGLAEQAQSILQRLYQRLVVPLEPFLSERAGIWLAPHGALWDAPFAALHDGERFLVERYLLHYLPGMLPAPPRRKPTPQSAAVRAVVMGYSDGGRLVHAVHEARAVADVLGTEAVFLEDAARIETLRAAVGSADIVHLATHGIFRPDAPLFSALHLADGELTAEVLETWRVAAGALVTLSACETGMSASRGSDRLGLARSFWRAGAQRLLVSRWMVDDASTAELMRRFYNYLQLGKSPAAALQKAQVAELAKYRHPFYWAGFELLELL